jgi:thymidylate synthase ThyX
MTIEARIELDSTNALGVRLTTWVIRYPRFFHAEVMTHRMFSRNASSSRAIPVKTQCDRIEAEPAMPVEWGANKPGMQATEVLLPENEAKAKAVWLRLMKACVDGGRELADLQVHKQIANRVAEPWSHIAVVLTGTEFANYFALRYHPDAQPEFRVLATIMAELYQKSVPKFLGEQEWHLPFIQPGERDALDLRNSDLIKVSTARCARVSHLKHDGKKASVEEELALFDKLAAGKPLHASPTEHQATPFYRELGLNVPAWRYPFDIKWDHKKGMLDLNMPWSGNLRGWFQHRQGLAGQNILTPPWEK